MRIQVENLTKVFRPLRAEAVRAVDDVSVDVGDSEFLVILGPSGSGKTTLLRCIAGLERADAGEIWIDGKLVFSAEKHVWVPPERRGVNMVFQSYALWPHMTVFENVAYPLRTRRLRGDAVRVEVERILSLVECGGLGKRYPAQLSGGQQQRVALARSIVGGNRVVLFDEPLSAVDARVRDELRRELVNVQRELEFASVYITHDQTEASMMGHRVAVMSDGKIRRIAPPRDIYDNPNSLFVAEFMGATNRFVPTDSAIGEAQDGLVQLTLPFGKIHATTSLRIDDSSNVVVIFRPERCRISADRPAAGEANHWECVVARSHFLGFCTEYQVRINESLVLVRSMARTVLQEGSTAWLAIDPDDVHVVSAG